MQSLLCRWAWAGSLVLWAAGAQAVVFDPDHLSTSEPMLVTATSASGSITVNANAYDFRGVPASDIPRGSVLQIGLSQAGGGGTLAADVQAVDGSVVLTPVVAGAMAASFRTGNVMVASPILYPQTVWTHPETTGLAVTYAGLASYLGQTVAPDRAGSYGMSYTLTINAISKSGQSLSLLNVVSGQVVNQQSFAHTVLVPAGFDLASVNALLTGTFMASSDAPPTPRGMSAEYKVQIDSITLTPTTSVPEPATWALMGLGLVGVVAAARGPRRG